MPYPKRRLNPLARTERSLTDRAIRAAVIVFILLQSGCGTSNTGDIAGSADDSNSGNDSDSTPFMRASIDGRAWSADSALLAQAVTALQPGQFTITGSRLGDYSMSFTLHDIDGPETYALGVGSSVPGGTAIVADATSGWSTPLTGSAGILIVTELTDSRITATFSFEAQPDSANAMVPLSIQDGAFDLEFEPTSSFGPPPGNAGSSLVATIGGTAWNATTVSAAQDVARATLVIVGINQSQILSISLGALSGPGTYPFASDLPVNILRLSGSATDADACCWATNFGGDGELIVTTLTTTRIAGTFTGTILPSPGGTATGQLLAEGTFDVALTPMP